jgi:hypothetical protein
LSSDALQHVIVQLLGIDPQRQGTPGNPQFDLKLGQVRPLQSSVSSGLTVTRRSHQGFSGWPIHGFRKIIVNEELDGEGYRDAAPFEAAAAAPTEPAQRNDVVA